MDPLSNDELHGLIANALQDLEADPLGEAALGYAPESRSIAAVARATRALLMALDATLGECRVAVPYKPLRPVLDGKGVFHWCCTHDPEHCTP